jgi:hypothetical protein
MPLRSPRAKRQEDFPFSCLTYPAFGSYAAVQAMAHADLDAIIHQHAFGLQKLKSDWRRVSLPTMVLFESHGTNAFPGRARGIELPLGLRP